MNSSSFLSSPALDFIAMAAVSPVVATDASPVDGIAGWLTIGALAVDEDARHHRRQQTTPPHPHVASATSRSRVVGQAVRRGPSGTRHSVTAAAHRAGDPRSSRAGNTGGRATTGAQGGGSRQEAKGGEGEKRHSTSDAWRRSTALTSVARGRGARLRRR